MASTEAADAAMFAAPLELADKSDGAISQDHPDLASALIGATKTIRRRAGWHIAPVREQTVQRTATRSALLLPTLRLLELVSVTEHGKTVRTAALDYAIAAEDDDEELTDGLVTGRSWSTRPNGIRVTFRHGFTTVPHELKRLCMQMAARDLGSPLGTVREQTLATSITHAAVASGVAGGSVILPHEDPVVAAYALPAI